MPGHWPTLVVSASLLWFGAGVHAQSTTRLHGYVHDATDGSPLFQAEVCLVSTGFCTLTDRTGFFQLQHIPEGVYDVLVSADGYKQETAAAVHVVSDISRRLAFRLERDIRTVAGIRVVDTVVHIDTEGATVLDRQDIRRLHPHDLADLLAKVEGIDIQRAGTSAGESRLSVRGSSPEHVLVLVDGQRINTAGTGTANLNSIPLEAVEQVEVHKGGASAQFGADALAGVVNIVTHPQAVGGETVIESTSRRGRWNTTYLSVTGSNVVPSSKLSTRLAVTSRRTDGDFAYSYQPPRRPTVHSGERPNNHTDARSYFASGAFRLTDESQLSFSGQAYRLENGLPGPARREEEQALHASRRDHRYLGSLKWDQELTPAVNLNSSLGLSRFEQRFRDTHETTNVKLRFDDTYINDLIDFRSTVRCKLWRCSETRLGVQLQHERLDHEDALRQAGGMGRTTRDSRALFLSAEQRLPLILPIPCEQLTITAAARYDKATTAKDSTSLLDMAKSHEAELWSPKVGVTLSHTGWLSYSVWADYGKSFRLPAINALFWQSSSLARGNPGLRPERAEHSEAGIDVATGASWGSLRAGVTYFHQYISDLIVWTQGQGGAWRPVNLAAALLCGHEDYVSVELLGRLVELEYQNTITISRNRARGHSTYGKELVFTPHYVQTIAARMTYRCLYGGYSVRHVGHRHASADNQNPYPSYRVDDIVVGVRFDVSRRWHTGFEYRLYNANNEDYVLIAQYPVPRSEWGVGVTISYGGAAALDR